MGFVSRFCVPFFLASVAGMNGSALLMKAVSKPVFFRTRSKLRNDTMLYSDRRRKRITMHDFFANLGAPIARRSAGRKAAPVAAERQSGLLQ